MCIAPMNFARESQGKFAYCFQVIIDPHYLRQMESKQHINYAIGKVLIKCRLLTNPPEFQVALGQHILTITVQNEHCQAQLEIK